MFPCYDLVLGERGAWQACYGGWVDVLCPNGHGGHKHAVVAPWP